MSTIEVLSPGLHTTVQDLGRWGCQAEGVPVSGAMDPFAHRRANALVGNPRIAATLEVTLTGPSLRLADARLVAVAGCAFELFLDDLPVSAEQAIEVAAGSTLRFGARSIGARAYIGISGGVDAPPVLGSRATHVTTRMGGWCGRALRRGDRLPLGTVAGARMNPFKRGLVAPSPASAERGAAAPSSNASDPVVVRLLSGPQDDRFTAEAMNDLISEPYVVGVDSNRMAYRLEGRALRHRIAADIISDPTALGSLQVPATGQPLLLMADRQTTGGYPKIATVISADIGVAAQAAPGDRLQFRLCEAREAIAALIARERAVLAIEGGTAA
jgi:antagonist of KipI